MANDFLTFGTAGGANVMTQVDYAALAARLSGFSAGTAASLQLNKVWRQSSIMSSVLGQFIEDGSGVSSIDDGTTATLLSNLTVAIRAAAKAGLGSYSGVTSVAVSTVFVTTDLGKVITVTASGTTQTLPAVANTTAGNGITFSAAGGALIIKGNAAELITYRPNISPANTIALNQGEQITLVSTGSAWLVASYSQVSTDGIAGSHSNLKLSANGTTAAVAITADAVCVKDSNFIQKVLNVISLSASIAASGVNGLDTGVSAANTWYSVWVIWNGTTTASLLSLSATAPTMPVGYTHKARVGWIRSDSTANKFPLGFIQFGKKVQYVSATGTNVPILPIMASGVAGTYTLTAITWAAVATANYIPPTAGMIKLNISRTRNTGSAFAAVAVAPNTSYQGNQSTNPGFFDQANVNSWGNTEISMITESANIQWASSAAGGAIACIGWEDE